MIEMNGKDFFWHPDERIDNLDGSDLMIMLASFFQVLILYYFVDVS